eukprot:5293299-Alexandrium_andersonii.AAC.1
MKAGLQVGPELCSRQELDPGRSCQGLSGAGAAGAAGACGARKSSQELSGALRSSRWKLSRALSGFPALPGAFSGTLSGALSLEPSQ